MLEAISGGLSGLISGFVSIHWSNPVMILVGLLLLYLGIKKGFEPLLLVPIGFGAILVNIPLTGLMEEGGFLRIIYDAGVMTELFPLLIFVGIGAMTDFGPLLENPKIFLLGAAGSVRYFSDPGPGAGAWFYKLEAVSIGIIGACDGPTAIYVTSTICPPSFRRGLSGGLFLYVSGPCIPAPYNEAPDHKRRENDQYGERKKIGFQDNQDHLPFSCHSNRGPDCAQRAAPFGDDHAGKSDEGVRCCRPAYQGL